MDNEQLKELVMRNLTDSYNLGWKSAVEHIRKQLVKDILSDGVISTNVDVDHLERIVRIIDEIR